MDTLKTNAISVYGDGDGIEDFPVLKAFQQYIDAEQAKSRKRMLSLSIFFGVLLAVVVIIFVMLVMHVTTRNQQLNDRLVEFAMKERERTTPVVGQPQPAATDPAIQTLTMRLEEFQKKLLESEASAKKLAVEAEAQRQAAAAAAEAAKPKPPSPLEQEVARLRAQLAVEAKKNAEEKERNRQLELEAYRRKHYPECYAPVRPTRKRVLVEPIVEDDEEDDDAITYFDSDDEEDVQPVKTSPKKTVRPQKKLKADKVSAPSTPSYQPSVEKKTAKAVESEVKPAANAGKSKTTIDVDIQGANSPWVIPE